MSVSGSLSRPRRRMWAGSTVTDANGNATFTFPAGTFTAVPNAAISCGPTANTNLVDSRIVTLTATSCTVNVQQALAVTVLAISVLAAKVPANGVTVQLIATEAGA